MWFQWAQLDRIGEFGNAPQPSPLLGALSAGLTQTWGYLLVAVVAFTAAWLVPNRAATTGTEPVVADGTDDRA